MIKGPKKSVSVTMPLPLYESLKNLSSESSWTLPAYIRQILKCYLRQLEQSPEAIADWLPVKAWKEQRQGSTDSIKVCGLTADFPS